MKDVTRAQVLNAIVATLKAPWPNAKEEIDSRLPSWMNQTASVFFEENRRDEHAEILRQGMIQMTRDGSLK